MSFITKIIILYGIGIQCNLSHDIGRIVDNFLIPDTATKISFVVQKGKLFNIKLKGNPTTGYTWILINGQSVIENEYLIPMNLSREYQTLDYNDNKQVLGGNEFSGCYNFVFKAKNEASDKLHLLLFAYRRFRDEDKAARVVTILIKISNNK